MEELTRETLYQLYLHQAEYIGYVQLLIFSVSVFMLWSLFLVVSKLDNVHMLLTLILFTLVFIILGGLWFLFPELVTIFITPDLWATEQTLKHWRE